MHDGDRWNAQRTELLRRFLHATVWSRRFSPFCTSDKIDSRPGYCETAPNPPNRHALHIPNPLPLAWIKPQRLVSFASSVADSSALANSVSEAKYDTGV